MHRRTFLAAGLSASAAPPMMDLANDTARQVIVDREPGQYLGHPTTVALPNNVVLCVYPKGHGKGAIQYKRSDDGGLTWSKRRPTPDNWSTSLETPTIHAMTDDHSKRRLVLFSGLHPIRSSISEDDGRTWTPLAPIGDFGGIVAMSSVIRLYDGRYLALFHDDGRFFRQTPSAKREFVVYKTISKDGGRSWSEAVPILRHPEAQWCEPGALQAPGSSLQIAILLRENSRKFNSFVSVTDDEGGTWSKPRELPPELTGDRHVATHGYNDNVFITFRDMAKDSPTRGDWVAWYGKYDDVINGRPGTGKRIRLMKNHKGTDCGYPGVEHLYPGPFLLTSYGHWTPGQEPYIVSIRLHPNELV